MSESTAIRLPRITVIVAFAIVSAIVMAFVVTAIGFEDLKQTHAQVVAEQEKLLIENDTLKADLDEIAARNQTLVEENDALMLKTPASWSPMSHCRRRPR